MASPYGSSLLSLCQTIALKKTNNRIFSNWASFHVSMQPRYHESTESSCQSFDEHFSSRHTRNLADVGQFKDCFSIKYIAYCVTSSLLNSCHLMFFCLSGSLIASSALWWLARAFLSWISHFSRSFPKTLTSP